MQGNSLVIGTLWGDTGKGNVIVYIINSATDKSKRTVVIRYNGTHNAGHTVWMGDKKYVSHILPSGLIACAEGAIGPDVAVCPRQFSSELNSLENKLGSHIKADSLKVDKRAHIIMPWHMSIEGALEGESSKSGQSIGTTMKGTGPVYTDAAARYADFTAEDLVAPDFRARLEKVVQKKAKELEMHDILKPNQLAVYVDKIYYEYKPLADKMRPYVLDTTLANYITDEFLLKGNRIIGECANGSKLDRIHGTRPYITSSTMTTGAFMANTGIPLDWIENIIGVAKAYWTRVGNGPFPTEIFGEDAKEKATRWDEFGATTGRMRRVGWPDFVLLRDDCLINGFTELAVTNTDKLVDMDVKVCCAYLQHGSKVLNFPPTHLENVVPLYAEKTFRWPAFSDSKTEEMIEHGWVALPEGLQQYIAAMVTYTGTPVSLIGVGKQPHMMVEADLFEQTMKLLPGWRQNQIMARKQMARDYCRNIPS